MTGLDTKPESPATDALPELRDVISCDDLRRHTERAHELRAAMMRQMARAVALFVAIRVARAKRKALGALTRAKEAQALRGEPAPHKPTDIIGATHA